VFLDEWFVQHSCDVELEWDGIMEVSNQIIQSVGNVGILYYER
jgi:hypothetical protein